MFAQSTDQCADQESPSAETASPFIPIDWAAFDSFDTGYESSVALHDGVDPNIAINDNDDVIEVHQASPDDHRLHYTRAKISGNRVTFGKDHPFFSTGVRPAVTLLKNGYVVEMHGSNKNRDGLYELHYRVGSLHPNNSTLIDWPDGTTVGHIDDMGGVGTDGNYLVSTAQRGTHLYYSSAIAP